MVNIVGQKTRASPKNRLDVFWAEADIRANLWPASMFYAQLWSARSNWMGCAERKWYMVWSHWPTCQQSKWSPKVLVLSLKVNFPGNEKSREEILKTESVHEGNLSSFSGSRHCSFSFLNDKGQIRSSGFYNSRLWENEVICSEVARTKSTAVVHLSFQSMHQIYSTNSNPEFFFLRTWQIWTFAKSWKAVRID